MNSSYCHTKVFDDGIVRKCYNGKIRLFFYFQSQLATVLAVTCYDRSCTSKSCYHYNVSAIHPWNWLLLSFQIISTYYSTMFLADLSHARMVTASDLTCWTSDFARKSSALKFWITRQRGNLYVPTCGAITSSPSTQSPRSVRPPQLTRWAYVYIDHALSA